MLKPKVLVKNKRYLEIMHELENTFANDKNGLNEEEIAVVEGKDSSSESE